MGIILYNRKQMVNFDCGQFLGHLSDSRTLNGKIVNREAILLCKLKF